MGFFDNLLKEDKKKPPLTRLPALDIRNVKLPDVFERLGKPAVSSGKLPNASIVYAVGAGMLFAFALYSFFTGAWFTALILLIPAGALVGFALHYLSYPSKP